MVGFFNPRALTDRIRYRASLQMFDESGYITPLSGKRTMRGWHTSANSADWDSIPKLPSIRAASRDLFMNNPVASGALRRIKTNAVGYGLNLQSRINREILGFKGDSGHRQADAWERKTESEFNLWAQSQDCDAARSLWFQDLTGLAFLSMVMSGDVFPLLLSIPRPDSVYDLRIMLVEADYICNPQLQFDTNKIAGGVEVDDFGAPIAYHFRKPRLNDMVFSSGSQISDEWSRITAFGDASGRRQVLHLFTKERPGTRRGIPLLATVVEELKQITRLSKAE